MRDTNVPLKRYSGGKWQYCILDLHPVYSSMGFVGFGVFVYLFVCLL